MQTTALIKQIKKASPQLDIAYIKEKHEPTSAPSPMIDGWHQTFIQLCMWMNVLVLNFIYYKNPFKAIASLNKLRKLRSDLRGNHAALKYSKTNGKYYFTYAAPGFPSKAFSKYVLNNIKRTDAGSNEIILDTLIFGITKKCGYQCEHCFEWNTLNKPETLTQKNLLSVIKSFQKLGITQLQLSGGEPLNRFDDIVYLLKSINKGTDVWIYTSGYHFTMQHAAILKYAGLTGITVSLDHWIPELHNNFRGKKNAFEWAEKAVANARENNLAVCLSLCATKDFITQYNLEQYAQLAKQWGVLFIQILEPRAIGHYAEHDVAVSDKQIQLLENFYKSYNYSNTHTVYPLIIYHGFYSRRIACGGGGKHYVYVDTDGDVHNCPFCQRKIFSAMQNDIKENLRLMLTNGCNVFNEPKKYNA